jgi:uncharacterized protein (TIGR02646 family)
MRPVERGDIPKNPATGSFIVFKQYDQARPYLIEKLGTYCSYCERRINNNLAVEHIQPKAPHPELELNWDNFLIACTNCNSIKGNDELTLNNYYWPDRDNTARAFEYLDDGRVRVNPSINDVQKEQAQRTLELTGLDRLPGHPKLSPKDRRWSERLDIWGIAKRKLEQLKDEDTSDRREDIVELSQAHGCWSVWMAVFREDADMLKRFVSAFPGTCEECFDEQFQLVPRPGGAL